MYKNNPGFFSERIVTSPCSGFIQPKNHAIFSSSSVHCS
jgi:hypothetical protein